MCKNNVLLFCAVVLPGWLFDKYSSYDISFYIGGASILVSGIVIMSLAVSLSGFCRQR